MTELIWDYWRVFSAAFFLWADPMPPTKQTKNRVFNLSDILDGDPEIQNKPPPSSLAQVLDREREILPASRALERRFYFHVNSSLEVSSSVSGIDNQLSSRQSTRPHSAEAMSDQVTQILPFLPSKRPSSAVMPRMHSSPTFIATGDASRSEQLVPKLKVQMSYYSVRLEENELEGPRIDYTQDFRRFAYRDFALKDYKQGSNISPEILLKWVTKARPRNQDDVYPILQLCKGILKDLMEAKLSCRLDSENAFHAVIEDLRKSLKERESVELSLKGEIEDLQGLLVQKESELLQLQTQLQMMESEFKLRDSTIFQLKSTVTESSKTNSDLKQQIVALEKKLNSATIIAEQRAKDYFRAHNSLQVRMTWTVKETVFAWNADEKHQCFMHLLEESRSWIEQLRSSDFQLCPMEIRRDVAKKLLEVIKISAPSWILAVSDLFGCEAKDFLEKVARWYAKEGMLTDEVKYHQQVERLKTAIDGTDYTPIYDMLRQNIILGKMSITDLVFHCSGKTAEETMLIVTGMTLDEVNIFKHRRKEILSFVHLKNSNAAKEKQEHFRKRNLGFLHHNLCAADPMDVSSFCAMIAKIFARKIAKDIDHGDCGKKRLNIMKVTKNLMLEMYSSTADARMQISKLVLGVRAHESSCPRARVFGILAGIDTQFPWFERASGFMLEFITLVVEEISADPDILADFRKRNHLLPMRMMPPHTDRIEWTLTGHDFKVPLFILLRAAMRASEVHPCGYGYPRGQIQEIVDKASAPPQAYIDFQRAKIREDKEHYDEMRRQRTFERLSTKQKDVADRATQSDFRAQRSGGSPVNAVTATKRSDTDASASATKPGSAGKGGRSKRGVTLPDGQNRADVLDASQFHHDFGVSFEPQWKAWFDVFCQGLLLSWFEQHSILEARMAHIFDRFDEDGNGSIEFDEFKRLMDNSPMASKFNYKQLLQMFSELTSQDGLLTKHDWKNLFHHVQFDVLTMIRPRRDSVRRMLISEVSGLEDSDDNDSMADGSEVQASTATATSEE